jgi:hypothetical protein
MKEELDRNADRGGGSQRARYEKPIVQRVELAIDETLSTGCKEDGNALCDGVNFLEFGS